MSVALLSRTEVAAAFQKITTRISDRAEARGLTPEALDALLREDE